MPSGATPDGARVGVMVPTFNRPDLLRLCVLQLAAQTRPPDIICVHQNGHLDSYEWAVRDLVTPCEIVWLHTPRTLSQHEWYTVPLHYLLARGCSHFFWTDHDDLYLSHHVASSLELLREHDFTVSRACGLLFTRAGDWRYAHQVDFNSHAPGGMSSSMAFTRAFAQQLALDISGDSAYQYTDNVVAHVTMPKFRCLVSDLRSCIYHSHEGSVTSSAWLERAFAEAGPEPASRG